MTISAKLPETAFEQVWARARGSVLAYCRRATRNPADADDLCQRVAIRAWRGYATFRGDSSVLTWLLRIAEREAIRMNAGAAERQRRETPILPETPLPATPTRSAAADLGWVGGMVERAGLAGELTPQECQVVGLRLAEPDASWQDIGDRVGITASACAVVHCRAVPKLRVFLFQHHKDALGGPAAVADAFGRAGTALGPAEREVFDVVVLQGRTDYRRRGWQANLRRACGVVIQHVDPEVVAGIAW